jgi:hypothetical protein
MRCCFASVKPSPETDLQFPHRLPWQVLPPNDWPHLASVETGWEEAAGTVEARVLLETITTELEIVVPSFAHVPNSELQPFPQYAVVEPHLDGRV